MEIIVQAIKRGEIRELVSLAKKNLISCEVGAEWINISAEEFTKLVSLDNPEVKIKEIARELVSNMSIEEIREISDDISRERGKKKIAETKEQ